MKKLSTLTAKTAANQARSDEVIEGVCEKAIDVDTENSDKSGSK